MIHFSTNLQRFTAKGEKTGWTYLSLSAAQVAALLPGQKKSFRVKGRLDEQSIAGAALLPMGDGSFILPVKKALLKALGKAVGNPVEVVMAVDEVAPPLSASLTQCLEDDPAAHEFFASLPPGHQRYFSTWIESAKTAATQDKRIALAVSALARGLGFPEMIREAKRLKEEGLTLPRRR